MNFCVAAFFFLIYLLRKCLTCKSIQNKWTHHWDSTIINSQPVLFYNLHVLLHKNPKGTYFHMFLPSSLTPPQTNPYHHSSLHKVDFPKGHIQIKCKPIFKKINSWLLIKPREQWQRYCKMTDNPKRFTCTLGIPFPYLYFNENE